MHLIQPKRAQQKTRKRQVVRQILASNIKGQKPLISIEGTPYSRFIQRGRCIYNKKWIRNLVHRKHQSNMHDILKRPNMTTKEN